VKYFQVSSGGNNFLNNKNPDFTNKPEIRSLLNIASFTTGDRSWIINLIN